MIRNFHGSIIHGVIGLYSLMDFVTYRRHDDGQL